MNTQVKYIKPFSNGQITIPKEFRKAYGINNDSWLKMTAEKGKLILEPAKKEFNRKEWMENLLKMGSWDLRGEIEEMRKENEERLKKYEL